ncbi:MAG TPA: glycosyltransferase [Acidimicrobiia bacterium]|nr:glycosyltransferase [Acidimicrobiia bacterium]
MRRGVLVISASMGAGHDGAARELERRLVARGHDVRVIDYLKLIPFKLGGFVRWSYLFQLRVLPWTYDMTYKALGVGAPVLWGPVVRVMSFATRRALHRELLGSRPDAIVSTYPLASLVLGRMRKKGWLRVPVATYLTDFAVHPLWVHPGVDLHLAVSPISAETAAKRGGRENLATGPLVADHFRGAERPTSRQEMRRRLGIDDDERAILVVAGSWGVGDVPETVEAICRAGPYHPITICGRDDKLRASLIELGLGGTVIGWTDEMPALMSAADALVENAGGLTAMEAFAAGVPVVTFHPIAGHGKENAKTMATSGVSRYAHDDAELQAALEDATNPGPARQQLIDAGHALFAGDPTDHVEDLAADTRADALLIPFQLPKGRRRVSLIAASIAALYLVMTLGAQGVSALGVGVAKPPKAATHDVFVGVRVNQAELANRRVVNAIDRTGVTLVVDGRTALRSGAQLAPLAADGIDIANGGWGQGRFLRWNRAHDDCMKSWRAIAARSGVSAREFVPGRRIDGFDQIYCRSGKRKQRLVEANTTFRPERLPQPRGHDVYLLDGRHRDPAAVAAALDRFAGRVSQSRLHLRSLEGLR